MYISSNNGLLLSSSLLYCSQGLVRDDAEEVEDLPLPRGALIMMIMIIIMIVIIILISL